MSLAKAFESTAAQLNEARSEIESLKADNARLRGALQEAIALAEQWGEGASANTYMMQVLAPLTAIAQAVREKASDGQ